MLWDRPRDDEEDVCDASAEHRHGQQLSPLRALALFEL
jgi:hypothetical protein